MAGIKPGLCHGEMQQKIGLEVMIFIQFANLNYETSYAENSREAIRKQALHRFRTAALVEDKWKSDE